MVSGKITSRSFFRESLKIKEKEDEMVKQVL